jgi:hypothetical protein
MHIAGIFFIWQKLLTVNDEILLITFFLTFREPYQVGSDPT